MAGTVSDILESRRMVKTLQATFKALEKKRAELLEQRLQVMIELGKLHKQLEATRLLLGDGPLDSFEDVIFDSFAGRVRETLRELGGEQRPKTIAEKIIHEDPALALDRASVLVNVCSELNRMSKGPSWPISRKARGLYEWAAVAAERNAQATEAEGEAAGSV